MTITTIQAIIEKINEFDEEDESLILFAKKINGEFRSNSEFVLVQLAEDEMDMKTTDIAERECPNFEYFLELHLVKEMLDEAPKDYDLNKIIELIVHYAEFDC
jgi:hypothetical protein